jgi:hypothetical protein
MAIKETVRGIQGLCQLRGISQVPIVDEEDTKGAIHEEGLGLGGRSRASCRISHVTDATAPCTRGTGNGRHVGQGMPRVQLHDSSRYNN